MGAWGFSILGDDTTRDVYDDYLKFFNIGKSRDEITRKLTKSYRSQLEDDDDGPLFWLGLAKAQWDCGQLAPEVLKKVREIVKKGKGLDLWEEQGPAALAKRKEKLSKFLVALQEPNPKPRKPKKPLKRKPIFEAGDCLAVRLSDGDWGAVIVLAAGGESKNPAEETYGENIVGQLRYKGSAKPGREVFEARDWLWINHHNWGKLSRDPRGQQHIIAVHRSGFREVKERLEVVGRTEIRPDDPMDPRSLSGWLFFEQVERQDRWDRGLRD